LWQEGKSISYSDIEFKDLLKKIYPIVPYWNRIMRVQREIPSNQIVAGPKKGNIRELVLNELHLSKENIKEIRFREMGTKVLDNNFEIFVEKYFASNGTEYFISYETGDRKTILGFIRLRFPYNPFIDVLKDDVALIRELHVYGNVVPVHKKNVGFGQHSGIGSLLLSKAEEIAKEQGYKKLAIISGIGVREYYRKKGYFLDNYYMSKVL
jgi:elongator complex protein 3